MKKSNNLIISELSLGILSTTALVLCAVAFNGVHKKETITKGYSINELPTTIDLNDTEESDIRDYYSSLNSLPESERKGTNLLKNLKEILRDGQKYYSYDYNNGATIWQIYEIADRDWVKSPASSTTYGSYEKARHTL